jgi:hypothetical protein
MFFYSLAMLWPTAILVVGYLYWVNTQGTKKYFVALWAILLCILSVSGWYSWSIDSETTQFGLALLSSSSIWLNGSLMSVTVTNNRLGPWIIMVAVLLAFVSQSFCFFILATTCQIWGL